MEDTIQTAEGRYILIAVETGKGRLPAKSSLDELSALLETAGGVCAGRIVQSLERPDPGTYLGKGKVEELADLLRTADADGVIADDELTPAQLRNLAEALDVRILDRTLLILTIFSKRATTREAQMQIELARLQYNLSRLTGLGASMSRQGGEAGVHARGAGETKLELDRRYIRRRIDTLKEQLDSIAVQREMKRRRRQKQEIPVVALVGYTNAGKSTFFNRLTQAGVLEEDRLFATLDTTARKMTLPSGREIVLTDTVGFIQKLPHQLVKAFRATLEEAAEADILLLVVDASDEKAELAMDVTMEEIRRLGAGNRPVITVLNKKDRMRQEQELPVPSFATEERLLVSAFLEEDRLLVLRAIDRVLEKQSVSLEILLPYSEGTLANRLHENARVTAEEYRENGLYLRVQVPEKERGRLKPYVLSKEGLDRGHTL